MNKNKVFVGFVIGMVGVCGAFLLKKALEENEIETKKYAKKSGQKQPERMKLKWGRKQKTATLLDKLEQGIEYTQVEIQNIFRIPYRSVRRYVDDLIQKGHLLASGYGKGKRFRKV